MGKGGLKEGSADERERERERERESEIERARTREAMLKIPHHPVSPTTEASIL